MKYLKQLKPDQLKNKTCLLRVDLNISLTNAEHTRTNAENFSASPRSVRANSRLLAILPTIEFLTQNGAKVVILSHRGRPSKASSIKCQASSYSLKPFAGILSRLLKKPVHFIDFNIGKSGTSDFSRGSTSRILSQIREAVEPRKI